MAITYGMSIKEFWEDEPDLFWAYRFSYYERVETEQKNANTIAWLQGAYFYEAISIALSNSFGGKNSQKLEYSKQPYNLEPPKEITEEEKQEIIKQQVIDLKARIKQVNGIKSSTTQGKKRVGEKQNG